MHVLSRKSFAGPAALRSRKLTLLQKKPYAIQLYDARVIRTFEPTRIIF